MFKQTIPAHLELSSNEAHILNIVNSSMFSFKLFRTLCIQ